MESSFPPVIDHRVRLLILGSMPGKRSLAEDQYYAHPRNGFWPIMAALYGAKQEFSYQQRLEILLANSIGLWDVIGSCRRPTSLDSDIDEESILVNDFSSLLDRYPAIMQIFFNGAKAEQAFRRYVLATLDARQAALPRQRLISTSPANARYSLAEKIAIWRQFLPATNPR